MSFLRVFTFILIVAFTLLVGAYYNVYTLDAGVSGNVKLTSSVENKAYVAYEAYDVENPCGCADRVDYVCGRDGNTYLNKCFADCKNMPIVKETLC